MNTGPILWPRPPSISAGYPRGAAGVNEIPADGRAYFKGQTTKGRGIPVRKSKGNSKMSGTYFGPLQYSAGILAQRKQETGP
jgi:hypothetical protein